MVRVQALALIVLAAVVCQAAAQLPHYLQPVRLDSPSAAPRARKVKHFSGPQEYFVALSLLKPVAASVEATTVSWTIQMVWDQVMGFPTVIPVPSSTQVPVLCWVPFQKLPMSLCLGWAGHCGKPHCETDRNGCNQG